MKPTQQTMTILPSRHDRPRVVPFGSPDDIGGSALTTILLVASGGLIVLTVIAVALGLLGAAVYAVWAF